jgi:hypothetical protein
MKRRRGGEGGGSRVGKKTDFFIFAKTKIKSKGKIFMKIREISFRENFCEKYAFSRNFPPKIVEKLYQIYVFFNQK